MRRIYLIGYMGAGKTTIGRELATQLSFDFIDLDVFIEKRYNKSINQIFEEYGETRFREIENNLLKEVSTFENIIVSTGGGAACFFDNIDVMNTSGTTIYLETTPSVLVQRLFPFRDRRPLIKDKSENELLSFIESNLSERSLYYTKAHLIFNTDQIIKKEHIGQYIQPLIDQITQNTNTTKQ